LLTVKDILDALPELAAPSMKEEWDNVGLLCGRSDRRVRRALVALDPSMDAAREAHGLGCELLLTHHPAIFGKRSDVADGDPAGRTLLFLIENGISAVNLHTNLDSAPGGVNDCLAAALGLTGLSVLVPAGTDGQGRAYGLGRVGSLPEETALADFLRFVKERLSCGGVRYADGGRAVRRVAVGGGACAEFLPQVLAAGCDTFVTADVRYHEFLEAASLGVNLIDAGHYPTENVVCPRIADWLRGRFPELEVRISERHKDAVKFL